MKSNYNLLPFFIKNGLGILFLLMIVSCSKKKSSASLNEENYVEIPYDTVAVDSFSQGAISVDVAAEIRRSSVAYQDSLRKQKVAADLLKKEQDEKAKTETLEKEKVAADKKKAEAEKKKAEPKKE